MSLFNYITNLLGLKDNNIIFNDNIETEEIRGITYKVIFGKLTYKADSCPCCNASGDSIIKHGTKSSKIRLLPINGLPAILNLKKQRFLCKECNHTFTAKTNIVDEHCYISNIVKQHILSNLTKKISEKDIAFMNYVSHSTVTRCIDNDFKQFLPDLDYLPKQLCFDEFKSTRDIKGAMSFVYCDADTHKIIDIVENRQLRYMLRYFRKFRRKARLRVKYVCIDMYRPYVELIKSVFPNAKIIYDRFHIVNLISRALTKTRINSMKKFPINSMEYERLKRYWKLIQKYSSDLDCIEYKYFPHFKTWKSSRDVVEQSIEADEVLKYNYRVYQVLLSDIKNRDSNMLRNHLESFKSSPYINTYIYTALNTLTKDFEYVSNGCIEGINNYIKTLKRVAFSYKSFYHFKNRILISQKMIFPKKKDQATKSTLVA